LLLVQSLEDGEAGTLRIVSTLFHAASGQWLSSEFSVAKPENMQDFGSACTYGKRYAQQALLNISTEDDDDAASLNGASQPPTRQATQASPNGHAPEPAQADALAHPTEGHIIALQSLALTTCHEDKEVYDQRIRTIMKLQPSASVAPKLLTRTMSMAQYMTLFDYYTRLAAQLAKGKERPGANDSAQVPTPEPAATPPEPPAVPPPAASSSAGSGPADAAAVEELVREAVSLGLREKEVRHIVTHYPLDKARQILTDAARKRVAA
jgi:hypothetical protein